MRDPFDLEDGHAPEIALGALADGEDDIVPPLVRVHVDACDACATKLGTMARAALDAGDLVRLAQPVREAAPASADVIRVPWKLVVAGSAVAAAGAAFDFGETRRELAASLPSLMRNVPLALKSMLSLAVHLFGEHGESVAWTAAAASLCLVMLTVVVFGKKMLPEKSS